MYIMNAADYWDVTHYCLLDRYECFVEPATFIINPDHGYERFLQNISTYTPINMTPHPKDSSFVFTVMLTFNITIYIMFNLYCTEVGIEILAHGL